MVAYAAGVESDYVHGERVVMRQVALIETGIVLRARQEVVSGGERQNAVGSVGGVIFRSGYERSETGHAPEVAVRDEIGFGVVGVQHG